MSYYKDKKNGQVYAYDDAQLKTVLRMNELESLIKEKEPIYIESFEALHHAKVNLDASIVQLSEAEASEAEDDILQSLTNVVNHNTDRYNHALTVFNDIDSTYQPLKVEYDAIPSIFIEIRNNIRVMKKMTANEVNEHINPPVSKEQLIQEAEQRKQSLLTEAAEVIAPLQYAVDLNMATEEEKISLTAWKEYSVLLNRVDTSTAPDITWPVKPE